jgi:hypothetical protein
MHAAPLESDIVLIGTPLPDGTQVLVPRFVRVRSCHRLDGTAKIAHRSRSDARKRCAKHQEVYKCNFCAAWHIATTRRKKKLSEAEAHLVWTNVSRIA